MDSEGKRAAGREGGHSKAPKVGPRLECSRNSRGAVGLEWRERRG